MEGLLEDIEELPVRAKECLAANMGVKLPINVPYVGMGSSYFVPLTLRYCGISIESEIASEYYGYLAGGRKPMGVLLSQSGESSETLWCRDLFDGYCAVVNDAHSTLATDKRAIQVIDLHAGPESFMTTKTYVNSLIALYLGHGIDVTSAVERLGYAFGEWRESAERDAERIAQYLQDRPSSSLYVVSSGPNVATAHQSALVMSETLKRSWTGMSIASYDHGPKETAEDSVVILLDARGREARRIDSVRAALQQKSNAHVVDIIEGDLGETLSPISLIVRVNLLMNALGDRLGISKAFFLGGKITTVADEARPS